MIFGTEVPLMQAFLVACVDFLSIRYVAVFLRAEDEAEAESMVPNYAPRYGIS